MEKNKLMSYIDHTLLSPTATWNQIKVLCDEAITNSTASICIPPSFVKRAKEYVGDKIPVCTVVGFPLGYSTTNTKVEETKQGIADGADEIDMVINLGDVKSKEFDKITDEITRLKEVTGDLILKVIVETCYLTEEEKIKLCNCVTDGGADFIKTSTGFGSGGAKLEDIELFKRHIGPKVRMKASGGIKSREELEQFIKAGCQRIGTSSAIKMLKDS